MCVDAVSCLDSSTLDLKMIGMKKVIGESATILLLLLLLLVLLPSWLTMAYGADCDSFVRARSVVSAWCCHNRRSVAATSRCVNVPPLNTAEGFLAVHAFRHRH
eukprot:GHRQ01037321.1.p3 GENE.GHRQ01037321.1~~GHRQ01037321.1.p3  ORF type:complete len:104 (+),score=25.23 GHRQ01037321.1:314-625(+)